VTAAIRTSHALVAMYPPRYILLAGTPPWVSTMADGTAPKAAERCCE
jgi:hypothetical protein